mmetsp:Transcript_54643/g.90586  ORF Transcript_54643/g.90586 Transcript_54643/m.90586 type:complete len:304 (-) Transcript_54643:46-957(-)
MDDEENADGGIGDEMHQVMARSEMQEPQTQSMDEYFSQTELSGIVQTPAKRLRQNADSPSQTLQSGISLTPRASRILLQALRDREASFVVVQVVSLQRYSLDKEFFSDSGETVDPECSDAFDVTVSDGAEKIKCVLSTSLNRRVYLGWLRRLSVVRVTSWRHRKREQLFTQPVPPLPIVILTEISALPDASGNVPRMPLALCFKMRSTPSCELKVVEQVQRHVDAVAAIPEESTPCKVLALIDPMPLLGRRQHYLHLHSEEVELTSFWRHLDPLEMQDDQDDVSKNKLTENNYKTCAVCQRAA